MYKNFFRSCFSYFSLANIKKSYTLCSVRCVIPLIDVVALNVFLFLSAHSQRLVSVQSMLRQTGRYRTLERDLMELQERKLFEYFIVVALHKAKAGVPYLPEVTQQFPLKVKEDRNVITLIALHYQNETLEILFKNKTLLKNKHNFNKYYCPKR